MNISVSKVTSPKDLEQVFEIRHKVFVEEQQVAPEEEYDEFEDAAQHFIARCNDLAVGTARWRETEIGFKLERFAVLSSHRKLGIGSMLVEHVLKDLPSKENVYLHSQTHACALYDKHGFVKQGEEFMEASILHYKMVLQLP